jgi:hypothetical protein
MSQIKTLVKNIKSWTPDRDILELRDMLIGLGEITKHPLSYLNVKDIARSGEYKRLGELSKHIWGLDDRGYCLIKPGTIWDFTIRQLSDVAEPSTPVGEKMLEDYIHLLEEQGIKARDKERIIWRFTPSMMDMVQEAMEVDGVNSVQGYLDSLVIKDIKSKRLKVPKAPLHRRKRKKG